MRKEHFIIILLFLNLAQLHAQSKAKTVKHIDSIVAATNIDSTLQKVVVDRNPDTNNDENISHQQITVFFKDAKISKISCRDGYGDAHSISPLISSEFIDYYLENEQLCFINHRSEDNSRPGSCGYVKITNKFYFKNGNVIKHLKQGHNPCDAFAKVSIEPGPESLLPQFKSLLELAQSKKSITIDPHPGKLLNFGHFFVVICSEGSNKNCTETEVLQADSIAKMKDELQRLMSFVKEENANPEIDIVSKYKLKFIVGSQKSDYITGGATQGNFLKKCDQNIDLKDVVLYQAKSYSHRYAVVGGFPKTIEIGNTYTKSSFMRYYFEKIE